MRRTHEGEKSDAVWSGGLTRSSGETGESRWSEGVSSFSMTKRSIVRTRGADESVKVV